MLLESAALFERRWRRFIDNALVIPNSYEVSVLDRSRLPWRLILPDLRATILILMVLLLYGFFSTKSYYWDGVKFALRIESFPQDARYWTDPNHLIYTVAGGLLWRLMQVFHIDIRAIEVLQWLDIAAGIAGLTLFYACCRQLGLSRNATALFSVALALSAGWWNYSTDINSYLITNTLLLACLLVLLRQPRLHLLWVALLLSGATMFHQIAALFGVALLVAWLMAQRPLLRIIGSLSLAALLSLSAQFIAYRTNPMLQEPHPVGVVSADITGAAGIQSFVDWLTIHSEDSGFQRSIAAAVAGTATGTLKMFVGGKLADLRFAKGSVLLATAAIACLMYWLLRRLWGGVPNDGWDEPVDSYADRFPRYLLPTWIATFVLFLAIWMPYNSFYRLLYLPPLLLWVGVAYRSKVNAKFSSLLVVVLAISCWNFVAYIYPRSLPERNEVLMASQAISKRWHADDFVYYENFHTDNWTIRYFNMNTRWGAIALLGSDGRPTESIWLDEGAMDKLAKALPDDACLQVLDQARYVGREKTISFWKATIGPDCLSASQLRPEQ